MLDLYNKKYDMKILEKHILELKLIDILKKDTLWCACCSGNNSSYLF